MQDRLQTTEILRLVKATQKRSGNGSPVAYTVLSRTLKDDIAAPDFRKSLEMPSIPVATTEIREKDHIKRQTSVMRGRFRQHGSDLTDLFEEVVMPMIVSSKRSVGNG